MIYILDNFLPHNLFNALKEIKDFDEIKTPGKSFWISKLPEEFQNFITNKISSIEGKEIKNILCFLREAKENQDTDWRIHNDTIIEGQKPDRAIVLYINSEESNLNGTAFWEHENYGETYIESNAEEFDRMLTQDANDKSKWKLKSVIGYKENRLLSYPCNYFHSKYPNKFIGSRRVLVMFYKINNNGTK
jgi:hypothetical protein